MGILYAHQHDVFISYAHADNVLHDDLVGHFRLELKRKLEAELYGRMKLSGRQEVDIFMDREGLPANGDLTDAIRKAISESLFLIVFIGKWYPDSHWCGKELKEFSARFEGDRTEALERTFVIVLEREAEAKPWGNHLDMPERPIFSRFYDLVTGEAIPVFAEREGLALLSPRFSRLLRDVMQTMADRLVQIHQGAAPRDERHFDQRSRG